MSLRLRRTLALGGFLLLGVLCGAIPGRAADASTDAWYAVLFSGTPVGVGHDRWAVADSGHYYENHLEIRAARMGTPITMVSTVAEWDDDAGVLIRFRSQTVVNGLRMVVAGERRGDSVRVRTADRVRVLPWEEGAVGQAVADDWIRDSLRAGKREFELRMFDPEFGEFRSRRFVVRGDTTDARSASGATAIVDQYDDETGTPSATLWFDAAFDVRRIAMQQMGVEISIERVAREAIDELTLDPNFDVIRQSMIACPGEGKGNIDAAKRVTYRLTFSRPGVDPEAFKGPNQSATARGDGVIDVAVDRERVQRLSATREELARYLRPDRYIQCDDPEIIAVADSVFRTVRSNGLALGRALARFVDGYISNKSYGEGFGTAVDVLRSHTGDCTEHAVLLAALLRAAKIPARVVVGLAYADGALVGHMWTEAYVNGWETLDALDPATQPIRIRLAASSDERAFSVADIVGAYTVVGGMRAEIVDVRR
jgi:transglutaminase-like putative cysteine protease